MIPKFIYVQKPSLEVRFWIHAPYWKRVLRMAWEYLAHVPWSELFREILGIFSAVLHLAMLCFVPFAWVFWVIFGPLIERRRALQREGSTRDWHAGENENFDTEPADHEWQQATDRK